MNRVKTTSALLLSCLAISCAGAAEYNQVQSSAVSFGYKQMGVGMNGKFAKATTTLSFDPANASAANAQLEIDLASIDAGYPEANDEIKGKLWFNSKLYPTAKFVSSSVTALGGDKYEVVGKLTIKGKTLDAKAPFTFKQDGAKGVFDGSFTLKRLDYAIGEGSWSDVSTVANEIQIKFRVVAGSSAAAGKAPTKSAEKTTNKAKK